MIRPAYGLALMVLALAATPPWAAAERPDTVDSGLAELQAYLESVHSLRADFEQLMLDADRQVTQRSAGSFRLKRPGRFRWDYSEPFEQMIVADGSRLWIYDADLEQVTVRQLGDSLANTPATLLSGAGAVADSYVLQKRFVAENIDWTELVPRAADTDFRLVRLGFAKGVLLVMDLEDSLGQTTRIQFRNIEHNPELEATVFDFVPPDGADVIGADDL